MWTRSYWVLMTYIKRPLFWLTTVMFAGAIAFYFGLALSEQKSHIRTVDNVLQGEAVRTFSQLTSVLNNDPSQPVELDYGSLYREAHIGTEEHAVIHAALKSVEKLTNVVSLTAGRGVDQATIERIAKFPKLKRLSILADLGYDTLDLQPLTNLHELEEIQFGFVSRVASLGPLSELPKLEKLAIGAPMLIHNHGFDSIAKLPHLRVLSLPDFTSNPGLHGTVGTLAKSDSLKTIHYKVSRDQSEVISAVQSQLTGIQVKPSMYRFGRQVALFITLFLATVLGYLGMHVTGQFSLPASRLAPNFRSSHYLVAGVLSAALVVLLTGLLARVGVDVLTALSLMLLYGTFHFWSSTRLPQANLMSLWGRITSVLSLILSLLPLLALLVFGSNRPMLVEDFLMSGHILIPVLFIVIAAWLARLAYQNLETALEARLEKGMPAMLSMQDMQAASLALRDKQTDKSPKNFQTGIGWIVHVTGGAVLGITLFWILLVAFGYDDGGEGLVSLGAIVCLSSSVMCVCFIGLKWRSEMPYLASAITRPPNRVRHVERLMHGIAKDFVGLAPLFIASIIVISFAGGLRLDEIGYRIVAGVAIVFSVSIVAYAAILWAIAIRSIIGVIVLAHICFIPCAMVMLAATVIPEDIFATSWKTFATVLTACVISAFAVVAIILARRHFHRIEWARFI